MAEARADQEDRLDALLVQRVQLSGDARAFEQLVRRHQGLVRAQLRRLVHGDGARADELAQEVFLRLWRKLDQFRGESRFSTWLFRLAYSVFLESHRRGRLETEDDEAALEQLAAAASAPGLKLDLARALDRLPRMERQALMHCAELGLSHEEAAQVMDLPLGTLKSHVQRGKAKLREWLQAWKEVA
ncbi:RNA polymerase sigma factor [Pelomonas sp. SE-A7]|uniref:RNA polymerase sigma factor n=1 Tax=Pelomonas sp. SE-A7 TaxID=3054953 RepID=UPI00259CBE8F|nr:RNA polymerase sigma factor [Pelomonas sp. SE-A7]MDM4768481.1 RNA polymerase sigma factor [Pelomonas sp. SE-A7]